MTPEYIQTWRDNNRDRYNCTLSVWRHENRDEYNAYHRQYRKNNAKKISGIRQRSYHKTISTELAIRKWLRIMKRFTRHDKKIRLNNYQQLKKDFQDIRQYLRVA